MPKLIISNEDKQDFLLGQINSEMIIGACVEDGLIDEQHIRKLHNSMATAMFSVWRLMGLPDELFDALCKGDKKGIEDFLPYIYSKQTSLIANASPMTDKEKAIITSIVHWVVATVGMGYVLGAAFQRDDKSQGEEAPVKKV